MSQAYQQKDLGYPRTPTSAMFRVEMGDGSLLDVPVQIIADSRDEYYKDEDEEAEDTIGFIRCGTLDGDEIRDWAESDMNWDEVRKFAVRAGEKPRVIDWQGGWVSGTKNIVGEI